MNETANASIFSELQSSLAPKWVWVHLGMRYLCSERCERGVTPWGWDEVPQSLGSAGEEGQVQRCLSSGVLGGGITTLLLCFGFKFWREMQRGTCLSVGRDDSPGQSWHSCDSKAPKIFYDTVKNLSIVLCIVSVAAFNKCCLWISQPPATPDTSPFTVGFLNRSLTTSKEGLCLSNS